MFHPRVPDRVAATIPDIHASSSGIRSSARTADQMMVRAGRETLDSRGRRRRGGEARRRARACSPTRASGRCTIAITRISPAVSTPSSSSGGSPTFRGSRCSSAKRTISSRSPPRSTSTLAFLGLRPRELGTPQKRATTASRQASGPSAQRATALRIPSIPCWRPARRALRRAQRAALRALGKTSIGRAAVLQPTAKPGSRHESEGSRPEDLPATVQPGARARARSPGRSGSAPP